MSRHIGNTDTPKGISRRYQPGVRNFFADLVFNKLITVGQIRLSWYYPYLWT